MTIQIIKADYRNPEHANDIVQTLDAYAIDPMGGGKGLSAEVKENLVAELIKQPTAFSFLAYDKGEAIGLANCFQLFSTFNCKPLINIHDLIVTEDHRGQGVCQQILAAIYEKAVSLGCCKLTLEVLSGNDPAKLAYRRFGFSDYELDPEKGAALFWQMPIN